MTIISRSIRNQIIFWAGLCLLISNLFGITFSALTLKRQAEQARLTAINTGEANAASYARDVASVYSGQLNEGLDVTRELAQSLAAVSSSARDAVGTSLIPRRETVSLMLKSVLNAHPGFVGIYTDWEPNAFDGRDAESIGLPIADRNGRFTAWWARSGMEELELQDNDFTYSDEIREDYYRIPMETQQETLVEPYVDQVGGKSFLMTSLIVPILADQKFLGIAGVDITISDLQTRVDDLAAEIYNGTAQIAIISSGGIVVARSGHPDAAGQLIQEVYPKDWKEISTAIQQGKSIQDSSDQEIKLLAPIQVGETTDPWTVLLTVPKDKVTELADNQYKREVRLLWIMIGSGITFTVVILIFLWLAVNAMTQPIQMTASFLNGVAEGDLSNDLPQGLSNRSDEIGSLVSSAQSMLQTLRQIFTQLNGSAATLGNSSDRLLSISEQTIQSAGQSSARANAVAAAAEEMSATTISVAGGVEQVNVNLISVATSLDEMTATIAEIAKNSQTARNTTNEAVEQANRMSLLMKELGEAANKIGKVTETITGISKQTNLLALNATIEAAKAGEAGRGFAVVANEIRNLAGQAAESTDEIRKSIAHVQTASAKTRKEIEANSQVVQNVNSIVTLIVESIDSYSAAIQDIAVNIARASTGVTDASRCVRETAGVTQTIAADISGVSSSSSEIAEMSEQVQVSAEELAQVAKQLQEILAQFKA